MSIHEDIQSPLAQAVRIAGGQSAYGRLVGRDQSTVHEWLKLGKPLPGEYVLATEAATRISRHELRLDLYPREDCCADACPEHGIESPGARPDDAPEGVSRASSGGPTSVEAA